MSITSRIQPIALLILALAMAATACGDDDGTEDSKTTSAPPVTAAAYSGFRSQPAACGAATPDPAIEMSFDAPGDAGVTDPVRVVITTSCGDLTVELDPARAPQAVNSFVFLADQGYFDGQASHRVVPGNFLQAGDPTASGQGGPGYRLPDELPPAGTIYSRGTIAMANAGPNTAGSQFFIMLADLPLPPAYSIFGEVVDGFETLDAIESISLGPSPTEAAISRPLESLYLERVVVTGS